MQTWVDNAWIISLLSGSLCFTAAVQLWRYRESWAIKSLLVLMLSLFLWALGYGLALHAPGMALKLLWVNLEMTGIAATPGAMAMLALSYSRRADLLNHRTVAWIFILPAFTALLTWTNPYHHLIFTSLLPVQGGKVIQPGLGPGFWALYIIYPYLVNIAVAISLFSSLRRKTGREKKEIRMVVLGLVVATIMVVFYHVHLIHQQAPDPTAASFAGIAVMVILAVFLYRSPQTSFVEASGAYGELTFKVHVVRALTVVLIPTFTYFIISNLHQGRNFAGTMNLISLVIIVVFSLLMVNASRPVTVNRLFKAGIGMFLALLWVLCIYFLSQELSGGTILWSMALPMVCILAVGPSWGLGLALAYQVVSMAASQYLGNFDTVYFSAFGVRYIVVYLILTISLFYMEKKRLEFLRQTAQQRDSLLESDRRYRWATESGAVGVWDLDADGRKIQVDAAIFKLLGHPAGLRLSSLEELLELCPAVERPLARRNWRSLAHGLERSSFEMPLMHRQGGVHWFLIRGQMVVEGQGKQQGSIYGTITDVTERKRADEDKARLETQLRHSQKMEAVGTLAGGIAHEFNNLLSAIMGYAELAQDSAKDQPEIKENLDQIVSTSLRARDLIRQLLTFSRKGVPEVRPLNINHEILGGQQMLQRLLPRTVTIETHLAADLSLVEASASHVNQLLVNLVSNAAQAMPEGGLLSISTENVSVAQDTCATCGELMSGDYVRLTVRDTGQGMDQQTMSRIFEPFFTTKEVGQGTGLGLSVVHGIIRSYQGHIMCQSEVGRGTTFQVYLPALLSGLEASRPKEEQEAVLPGGGETILLVDDESALCEMGRRTLGGVGYQVLTASSGEAALELYREKAQLINLVVLDLGMPGMGGQKCLAALRALHPLAKIIVLSGYTGGEHLQKAMAAGAAAFLNKPTPKAQLLATVRAVLDGQERGAA